MEAHGKVGFVCIRRVPGVQQYKPLSQEKCFSFFFVKYNMNFTKSHLFNQFSGSLGYRPCIVLQKKILNLEENI